MSDVESDLRTTTENVLADAERLAAIETEKASLRPADPRMVRLSEEAAHIAQELVPKTRVQLELSEEATAVD